MVAQCFLGGAGFRTSTRSAERFSFVYFICRAYLHTCPMICATRCGIHRNVRFLQCRVRWQPNLKTQYGKAFSLQYGGIHVFPGVQAFAVCIRQREKESSPPTIHALPSQTSVTVQPLQWLPVPSPVSFRPWGQDHGKQLFNFVTASACLSQAYNGINTHCHSFLFPFKAVCQSPIFSSIRVNMNIEPTTIRLFLYTSCWLQCSQKCICQLHVGMLLSLVDTNRYANILLICPYTM